MHPLYARQLNIDTYRSLRGSKDSQLYIVHFAAQKLDVFDLGLFDLHFVSALFVPLLLHSNFPTLFPELALGL